MTRQIEQRDFFNWVRAMLPDARPGELLAGATATMYDGRVVFPAFGVDADLEADLPPAGRLSRATHVSVGLFNMPPGRHKMKRRIETWSGLWAVVLDDVFEKAEPPALEPSWKVLTKPGSEQWGYVLNSALREQATARALLRALAASGYTDPGGQNITRLVRLPGSKPVDKPADRPPAQWTFRQTRRFSLDVLCHALGIAMPSGKLSAKMWDDTDWQGDVLWHWIAGRAPGEPFEVLRAHATHGWVDIRCPWVHEHTDKDDSGTGYLIGSRGSFICHHGHCARRGSNAFLKAARALGAPDPAAAGRSAEARLQRAPQALREALERIGSGR